MKLGTPNSKGNFDSLYILEEKVYQTTAPKKQLQAGDEITLRIFHFNDLHNELRIIDKTKGDTHIFSQMVKIVNQARANAADNEIILFVSAGDDHMGNPLDELLGFNVDSFQTSTAYAAYSKGGLDVSVIGNHDLDRGADLLAKAIEQDAKFPIVSANLYGSKFLSSAHYHPAIIGIAKGLRIGVIGLTTQQKTLLRQKNDPDLDAGDLLTSLEHTLAQIVPWSDIIIILSHVGYNGKLDGQIRHELKVGDIEIADTAAKMTDKPMIVIGGHMHLKLNEKGLDTLDKTVPIVQASAKGNFLGEVTFSLFQTDYGLRSQVSAHLIPLKRRDDRVSFDDPNYANYEHDENLDIEFEKTVMAPMYAMLDDKLQEVIGVVKSSEEITNAKNIVDRYVGETAIANFMNDAIVAQSPAVDIATFNASGINGGVKSNSEISFNDWYNVMPFADSIVIVPMTGAQIKKMLASNAQRIVRPEELKGHHPHPLDLTNYISRGFLHFSSGLRYTIKLNTEVTTVVAQDIMLKGKPIEEQLDKTFNMAFSDFIPLRGAECWNGTKICACLPCEVIDFDLTSLPNNDTGLIYRNEIIAFIKQRSVLNENSGIVKDGRLKVIA